MYREIRIGSKTVPMLANAASSWRYSQCFHEDFLKATQNSDETEATNIFERLGYVMARQAEKGDLSKLSEEDFYVWLEQFDASDYTDALADIADLYTATEKATADPK